MAIVPILNLDPDWNFKTTTDRLTLETSLGDGYTQIAPGSFNNVEETVAVVSSGMNQSDAITLLGQLVLFGGNKPFQWNPANVPPYAVYTCPEWQINHAGLGLYTISGTFRKEISSQCEMYRNNIVTADIDVMLSGALTWLQTYSRNTLPQIANTVAGAPYLTKNSFHDVQGRGGYFPSSSGTSEGQFIGIRACLNAFLVTGTVGYRNYAIGLAQSLQPVLYRGLSIPTDNSRLYIPHWLYNVTPAFPVKEATASAPINSGNFGTVVAFTAGVGTLPGVTGANLANVYKVYSTDGALLWTYVYAPLISGTEYSVNYWVSNFQLRGQNYRVIGSSDIINAGNLVSTSETAGKIVLNNTGFTGNAIVVWSNYSSFVTIAANQVFEAFPLTRALL